MTFLCIVTQVVRQAHNEGPLSNTLQSLTQLNWIALRHSLPYVWPSISNLLLSTFQSASPSTYKAFTHTSLWVLTLSLEDAHPHSFPFLGILVCKGQRGWLVLRVPQIHWHGIDPLPANFTPVPSKVPITLTCFQFNWNTKMGQTGSIRHNCGSDLLIMKVEF